MCGGVVEVGDFADDADGAVVEFVAGAGVEVDHQIFVDLADPDHADGGNHIEYELCGCPCFHACAASDDFGTGEDTDGDVGCVGRLTARDAGEEDGFGVALLGAFDCGVDVGRGATGGDAKYDVPVGDADSVDGSRSRVAIVFCAFDASAECVPATSDESTDHFRIRAEGWRALGSIEYAESTARTSTDVDQSPALLERGDDEVDRTEYIDLGCGDCGRDAGVFGRDDVEGVGDGQCVDACGSFVAVFGEEVASGFAHARSLLLIVTFVK